jgi:hypothetical protein
MWNSLRFVMQHPLNARGRYKALRRVLSWQIASRLMQGPIAFPFVDRTQLFATRGMTGATGNWYCGLHEVSEMGFVLHALRPDDHFVDVGANIATSAATRFWQQARRELALPRSSPYRRHSRTCNAISP